MTVDESAAMLTAKGLTVTRRDFPTEREYYAYLREVDLREIGESDPEKDIYIALALLPAGVDVGDKLHYEMFAYTVAED